MEAESPKIIGIVGGSCAGKTWLCERLHASLGQETAEMLSLDDFYLDRSHLSAARRARLNFDHPRSIDWERLERVLALWSEGQQAAVPRYDFVTHGRAAQDVMRGPARVVLVEGLWLFHRRSLRRLFHRRIFIRTSPDLCLERRLSRDIRERGRTREQVLEQLDRFTFPMFSRFVQPQERWAEVVLDAPISEQDVQQLADDVRKDFLESSIGI